MSQVPSSLRWSTMVAAVEPVTAPEEMPRTLSKTWLMTSSGVSVTVVPTGRIGAAAETSALVTSGGHAIGRVTAAMAVGVHGGVLVLPKSILLIDAGVEVAAAGGVQSGRRVVLFLDPRCVRNVLGRRLGRFSLLVFFLGRLGRPSDLG
jgi:hypothetical protein